MIKKILVCGGRTYSNYTKVKEVLLGLDDDPFFITGGGELGILEERTND